MRKCKSILAVDLGERVGTMKSGEVLRARDKGDKGDKTASCMAEETAPGEETAPQTKTNRAEREKDSEG